MAKKNANEVEVTSEVLGNLNSLKRFSEVHCANINILAGKASFSLLFGIEREAEENKNVLVKCDLTAEEITELKAHVKTLLRFPENYKDQDSLVNKVTESILQLAEVVLILKVK